MSNYSGLDAITATPFDKHNNGSAEIISLWPLTAEIKSAKINSVNSMVKSLKFKPTEITRYTVCMPLVIDLGDMTLGPGHDTPLGYGKQLCAISFRSNMTVRSYGPDPDFGYLWTLVLTLQICPRSKSWHTLGLLTAIVSHIIQIKHGSEDLWHRPGFWVYMHCSHDLGDKTLV